MVEPNPNQGDNDHTFEYWAGNPSVEIIHGHIKVSGSRAETRASSASRVHRPDSPESCMVLASSVPCHMSASEFCDFLGAFGAATHRRFRHCRVLHGRNSEEYLIALLMASPQDVELLINDFHGKRFNAIEPGACSLHFVVSCQTGPLLEEAASPNTFPRRWSPVPQHADLKTAACPATPPLHFMLPSSGSASTGPEASPSPPPPELPELFVGTGAGTQSVVSPTPGSGGERPFCAVCLETVDSNPAEYQLTELGGGVPLTILCGHTFHARCLSRWCDTTCPVCRFQQHPYQTSSCDVCGQAEGVHICLVCGFIGCTSQQGEGHAQQHFEGSSHAYALDVNTQHVWDYAGNGYVHRLLFNDQDGKMVEHTVPQPGAEPSESITARSVFGDLRWADMEDDDCEKARYRKVNLQSVLMEVKYLIVFEIYHVESTSIFNKRDVRLNLPTSFTPFSNDSLCNVCIDMYCIWCFTKEFKPGICPKAVQIAALFTRACQSCIISQLACSRPQ